MKTTKKDFELFRTWAKHYIDVLGLKEWSMHFEHGDADGSYAITHMGHDDKVAIIIFSKEWDDLRQKNEHELKRLALHEVCHLLMNPLIYQARERFTTEEYLKSIEHTIIRRIENLIDDSSDQA